MNATVINDFYPPLIKRLGSYLDVKIIDLNSYWRINGSKSLTCDGCHPLPKGNELIATAMVDALKQNFKQKIRNEKELLFT